jgi:hypothetical protein
MIPQACEHSANIRSLPFANGIISVEVYAAANIWIDFAAFCEFSV